ncbi:hypothetical protein EV383_5992 [Pseudonocardia sediminis]|uniref:Uncharacterized protein n=1 Tax=Pseudonocardia sediminis TaxID=1397368 RepID=A0A4Q7V5M9_PSEST|nr:hypothetical protein [Pseudonocardia sediminis]RZT89038.1 hypothetical protein EV383_5992 [Pseudonocardia sediminis]
MSDTGNPAPEHPRTGRDDVVLADGEIDPKQFPRLFNISAGFLYAAIILPLRPEPPEYVALP